MNPLFVASLADHQHLRIDPGLALSQNKSTRGDGGSAIAIGLVYVENAQFACPSASAKIRFRKQQVLKRKYLAQYQRLYTDIHQFATRQDAVDPVA